MEGGLQARSVGLCGSGLFGLLGPNGAGKSTLIVEDVAMLCPRFAVIRQGRVVAITSPTEAKAAIAGTLFEGTASAAELSELQRTRRVTQAVLFEGRNRVRIHEPGGAVPPGFDSTLPTLEDAWLLLMKDSSEVAR